MRQVIYLTGLGDHTSHDQKMALSLWRLVGLKVYCHPLGWANNEPFLLKLERVVAAIDKIAGENGKVSLVGVSAGASLALQAFNARKVKVNCVVYICGKINNAQGVSAETYRRNPAFKESLRLLPASLNNLSVKDRHRILSIRPLKDNSVPIKDTKIPGVSEKIIPTRGHSFSIAFAITFGMATIAKFIKETASFS